LKDDVPLIVVSIYIMNGDATFGLSGFEDGLMDTASVHAFSTELGKEGRVDVHDSLRIGLQHVIGYVEEEACQYNEVGVILTEKVGRFALAESRSRKHFDRNAQRSGSTDDTGFGLIGQNSNYLNGRMTGKIADYPFGVCSLDGG
jgi:hypothetical protein